MSDKKQNTVTQEEISSAADQIIEKLGNMIKAGEIKPGQRFPSERTLAEKFNVSRGTVREALHHFETLGMTQTRAGSGSYLIDDPETLYKVIGNRQMIERYNWAEMIETRQILEVGIVRLAAERATREDKLSLRSICDNSINAGSNADENYTYLDYQLHREFVQITRNSMLLEMFEALKDTFLGARKIWAMANGSMEMANQSHLRIVNAIIAGDRDLAVQEMQEHLDYMRELYKASQEYGQL